MSVGSVLIALQASRSDGRSVTTAEFITPLAIQTGEVEALRADEGPWASGLVYFAVIRYSDFDHVDKAGDAGAQSEAFFSGVVEAFQAVARFLDQRPVDVFSKMRANGLSIRIFVEVRMNQDQMELELPSEFLAACGRHGLGFNVISNDVPASEVWAAN